MDGARERGNRWPIDVVAVGGERCTIGAFEGVVVGDHLLALVTMSIGV